MNYYGWPVFMMVSDVPEKYQNSIIIINPDGMIIDVLISLEDYQKLSIAGKIIYYFNKIKRRFKRIKFFIKDLRYEKKTRKLTRRLKKHHLTNRNIESNYKVIVKQKPF